MKKEELISKIEKKVDNFSEGSLKDSLKKDIELKKQQTVNKNG